MYVIHIDLCLLYCPAQMTKAVTAYILSKQLLLSVSVLHGEGIGQNVTWANVCVPGRIIT